MSGPPVIGEFWTDAEYVPSEGTLPQLTAFLLWGPNPGRLVRVTTQVSDAARGVPEGHVGYARCVNVHGSLGHEFRLPVEQFTVLFRRLEGKPPRPSDVPPERPTRSTVPGDVGAEY